MEIHYVSTVPSFHVGFRAVRLHFLRHGSALCRADRSEWLLGCPYAESEPGWDLPRHLLRNPTDRRDDQWHADPAAERDSDYRDLKGRRHPRRDRGAPVT